MTSSCCNILILTDIDLDRRAALDACHVAGYTCSRIGIGCSAVLTRRCQSDTEANARHAANNASTTRSWIHRVHQPDMCITQHQRTYHDRIVMFVN